jgi:creatinine amidohydrolase
MKMVEVAGELLNNAAPSEDRGVIVPFGSVEYHGHHLPLGTDGILAEAFAMEVSNRCVLPIAPTLHYGPCLNLRDHPGTISIRLSVYQDFVFHILSELARGGFKKLFLFSGHAEESQLISLREASERLIQGSSGVRVHIYSTYHLCRQLAPSTNTTDLHAGELETSLLMYAAPHLVNLAVAGPESEKSLPTHEIVRCGREAWPSGVAGAPRKATRELGEIAFSATVQYLVEHIDLCSGTNARLL